MVICNGSCLVSRAAAPEETVQGNLYVRPPIRPTAHPSIHLPELTGPALRGLGLALRGLGLALRGLGLALRGLGLALGGLGQPLGGLGQVLRGLGLALRGLGLALGGPGPASGRPRASLWEAWVSLWEAWVSLWEAWVSLWEAWASLLVALGGTDGHTDVRTYGRTYRFPLYSTGLRPLRFPPGTLPKNLFPMSSGESE